MKKTKVPTKKSQPKLTSFFAKTTFKKTNSQTNPNDKENVEPVPSAPVTPNRLSQKLSENLKVSVTQPESPVSNPKRKEPEKSESPDKKPEACTKKDNIEEKDEPLQPKNKRRKVTVAFSDSEDDNEDDKNVPFSLAGVTKKLNSKKKIEDSDDDFKPETQESASDEVMDEDDIELESEESANSDNSEDFAETKKTKKSSKSKQTTPSRPTTPKLKENISEATTPVRSVSPNTSALSQFRRATPSPNPGSRKNVSSEKNASKEKVQKYFHETLKFLKPEFIKDKMKRRPDHADYDPGTLFIPENGLEKKTPPMTHQFFKLKEDQFDTIFMFKVGKFYEFYHTDAQIAINVLGLKKQNGDNLKCGFPEMACDRYMRALVEAGYKVARVEQTETTAELADRKGDKSGYHWETKTVIREIVSIATAGTVSSANAFDFDETDMGKAKNFFFSVFIPDDDSTRIGIVALHSGRGEWFMTFLEDDDRYHSKLLGILSQFKISQVIFPKKTTDKRKTVFQRLEATGTFVEKRVDRHFWKPEHLLKFLTKIKADWKDSDELFKSYFNMGAEPNSENGGDVIIPAFAALCQYFEECKLAHVVLTRPLLNKLSGHSGEEQEDSKMVIDAISQKNLDLDHMFKRINYTRTDFGQRQLHDWMQAPIMNISKICKRQECIKYLLENLPLRQRLIDGLLTFDNPKRGNKRMPDIPTLLQRLKALSKENVPKNHPMNRAQIYEIVRYSKNQLDNFCKLLCIFEQIWDEVVSLQEDTENMPELLKQILTFGGDHSFSFPDLSAEMKSWKKRFDRKAAIETGKIVPKRKSDEKYNALLCIVEKKQEKLNDFAAEVAEELGVKRSAITFETKPKKPHMFVLDAKYEPRLIEADWLIVNSKKVTKSKPKLLVVQRKSDQMAVSEDLAESELELEEYVRNQNNIIFIQWIESAHKWLQAVEALKLIDCLVSLSCYIESETDDMVIPNFEDSKDRDDALLELVKSRHPCMNLAPGQQLVANSAEFSKKVMILTGPNMGGKSTIMRQVALNVVLAQMGSYRNIEKNVGN